MSAFGPYPGVVDHVTDGDTVNVKLDVGFDLTVYARVRVVGINAPEVSTEAGKVARDYARQLLPVGTNVAVTSVGWDKFGGRIDGIIVTSNGVNFGTKMLQDGYAVAYSGGAR